MLLVHRRHVVEAVEIGQRLEIGLMLDQLLGAAVEQPDMRIEAFDDLAVELEHETQHAMSRWVLRPEINGEFAVLGGRGAGFDFSFGHQASTFASALAALAATDLLNRSQLTMNRS